MMYQNLRVNCGYLWIKWKETLVSIELILITHTHNNFQK